MHRGLQHFIKLSYTPGGPDTCIKRSLQDLHHIIKGRMHGAFRYLHQEVVTGPPALSMQEVVTGPPSHASKVVTGPPALSSKVVTGRSRYLHQRGKVHQGCPCTWRSKVVAQRPPALHQDCRIHLAVQILAARGRYRASITLSMHLVVTDISITSSKVVTGPQSMHQVVSRVWNPYSLIEGR